MFSETLQAGGEQFAPAQSDSRVALRLVTATRGECLVSLDDGISFAVRGERMLLLNGDARFTLEPAPGAHVRTHDIACHAARVPGLSFVALRRASPAFARLCALHAAAVPLGDAEGLIAGALACQVGLFALPEPDRDDALSLLLTHTVLLLAEAAQNEDRAADTGSRHVRRALRFLAERYMTGITARDIADHVGIHAGHLHRLFREETGQRVNEALTALRMEKAKQLLGSTDQPVTAIADAVGMATREYFSRAFKQYTGVTPQAYRAQYNVTCDYAQVKRHYYSAVTTEAYLKGLEEGNLP